MPERTAPRGFALIEVFVLVVVMAGLFAMLSLGVSDARRNGGLGRSIANMKRLGVGSTSYVADNQQMTATFWWSATEGHSEFGDLEAQRLQGGLAAAAAQAVDIMRRLHDPSVQRIDSWIPHIFYSHLVLIDYLGEEMPTPWVVSPGEKAAQGWQDDIDLPDSPANERWRYYSSYEVSTGFWEDEGAFGTNDAGRRIRQAGNHHAWTVPSDPLLGSRSFDDVRFPSEKVYAYERYQRFFGARDAFFAYPEARIPTLLADGSVATRVVGEANAGWFPFRETRDVPTIFRYSPADWEPDNLGDPSVRLVGSIRWTRGGAKGRDFGGDEIDTGQR